MPQDREGGYSVSSLSDRVDQKKDITFSLTFEIGYSNDFSEERQNTQFNKNVKQTIPIPKSNSDLNNIIGLTTQERIKLQSIASDLGAISAGTVVISEFIALGTATSVTLSAGLGVIATTIALPFAALAIVGGAVGLYFTAVDGINESGHPNLESLKFASDPTEWGSRVVGDIFKVDQAKALSYGRIFSAGKGLLTPKEPGFKENKFKQIQEGYGDIEGINTINEEYKNLQDEVIGLDKQYKK